jgi:hypothetical protein
MYQVTITRQEQKNGINSSTSILPKTKPTAKLFIRIVTFDIIQNVTHDLNVGYRPRVHALGLGYRHNMVKRDRPILLLSELAEMARPSCYRTFAFTVDV